MDKANKKGVTLDHWMAQESQFDSAEEKFARKLQRNAEMATTVKTAPLLWDILRGIFVSVSAAWKKELH